MESWKEYVVSFIACTLCCGILSQFISDSKRKSLIQLIFGIVLGIFMLRPLSKIDLGELLLLHSSLDDISGGRYIYDGEKMAHDARMEYIKTSCEAYILDRAKDLNAEIGVAITLNDDLIPVFSEICGEIGAAQQKQLQKILMTDLGIPKENQKWTWNQENSNS